MYLIVMDDAWDKKVWDSVTRFFPDNHNGSRVVLTTRLSLAWERQRRSGEVPQRSYTEKPDFDWYTVTEMYSKHYNLQDP